MFKLTYIKIVDLIPSGFCTAAVATLLSWSSLVSAEGSYPEDGWWWDADASGRGYFIERQKDNLFVAAFVYADDGTPEWLTANGYYTPFDDTAEGIGSFTGNVYRSTDGQCIGCAYIAPITVESQQGPVTIAFNDNQTAIMDWLGESIPIQRTLWAWADVADQLTGTWLMTRLENSSPVSQLVTIAGTDSPGNATIVNAVSGNSVGSVELLDGDLVLVLADASEPELPILIPESKRFYAGYGDAAALQVVAVRLDDMPLVIVNGNTGEVLSAVEQFTGNVSIVNNGDTIVINTDNLPNHPSPYWGQGSSNYEAPHVGMAVNPNTIQEQDITYRIPANPEVAASPSDTGLGPIGVAVNGVAFFNQYAGVDRATNEFLPLDNEIQSFDAYNGHPQNTGQYHYHFEPVYLTVADNAAFLGYALDGFPIYGPRNHDGSSLNLDECNGESHATSEYTDGIYHYHVTTVEPYIVGCFKGTPGTLSQ